LKRFLTCFLIINAAGFVIMTADKLFAKKNLRRIPERVLMSFALVGGSIGVLAAMYLVRHKTKHPKFTIGVPVILMGQIGLLLYLMLR